jgi:hypothetical protein
MLNTMRSAFLIRLLFLKWENKNTLILNVRNLQLNSYKAMFPRNT